MKQYSIRHTEALERYLKKEGLKLVGFDGKGEQLRTMQAWTVRAELEAPDGKRGFVFCLQSYETIVSIYRPDGFHRLGKWSTTTSRQQTTWERGGLNVRLWGSL